MAFAKTGDNVFMRRWGYGLYKLNNETDEFDFIEDSEMFSQNRIELFYEEKIKMFII